MPILTKGKTNWKYILILVILAVIVGGGILGYLKYFEKETISISQFPEIKKPEKVVEDETANWEIYISNRYGFKMKYPTNWIFTNKIISSDIIPSSYRMTNKRGYMRFIPCLHTHENSAPILLNIYFNPKKLDYINYGKEYQDGFASQFSNAISKKELTLRGNIKATKFVLEEPYLISKEKTENRYIIITGISREDLILELIQELTAEPSEATSGSIYYEGTNTYKNILSSLIFFEKNAVDWETLTRKQDGFEINYHKDWGFDLVGCNDIAGIERTVFFSPLVYIEEYEPAIQVSLRIWNKYIKGKEFNPEEFQCLEKCPKSITYYIPNKDKTKTAEIQLTFQEVAYGHNMPEPIPLDRNLYPLSDIEIEKIFNQMVSTFRFLE